MAKSDYEEPLGESPNGQAKNETNQQQQDLLTKKKDPITVSQFLELNLPSSEEIVMNFREQAKSIASMANPGAAHRRWLSDYVLNQERLIVASTTSPQLRNRELEEGEDDGSISSLASAADSRKPLLGQRSEPAWQPREDPAWNSGRPPVIKLNELVKRPELFNGYSPPPRKWIDDYERAAEANGWTGHLMVRYFPTFLEKSANDWLVTVARRKLGDQPVWKDLRAAFIRHYLGDSDRQILRQQLERTRQGEAERATVFIPRCIRMIELLEPGKKEEELVELIRSKLRFNYQEKLVLATTYTVEQLNDACLRIEANMSFGSSQRRNVGRRNEHKGHPMKEKEKSAPSIAKPQPNEIPRAGRSSGRKCYNCGKMGHLSAACRAPRRDTNTDNKPKVAAATIQCSGDDQATHSTSAIPVPKSQETTVAAHIRAAGQASIGTVRVLNVGLMGPQSNLIMHPVEVNGIALEALIDTGAAASIVDAKIVQAQNWPTEPSELKLVDARGKLLDVTGVVTLDLRITIGSKSLTSRQQLVVAKNLCAPILWGINLCRVFKMKIDADSGRPLSFKKGIFKKGVRLSEAVTIPARHAQVIGGNVQTIASLITTSDFHFDKSIIVANSLSPVYNGRCLILIVNTDTCAVQLHKGQQIASFEPVMDVSTKEGNKTAKLNVQSIMQLADTEEFVKIGDGLTGPQLRSLSNLLSQHKQAFSIKGALGFTRAASHRIELLPDARPFREKARRHALIQVEEAKKQIKQMLEEKVIQRSESPWCSEVVMVKKKDQTWRMCVDFRRLNSLTKKDSYPLPNIDECLEQIAGNEFFSQLDLASGYWQLPVDEGSRELTAFRVGGELYQFKRLPFGLTNAPATFQRLMNALFAGMKGLALQVFLDDICIASRTWPEHLALIDQVLNVIEKAGLKLNAKKCSFGSNEVRFLGHVISRVGVRPDPEKVRAMEELPPPVDAQGVKRVLGAFNYYRRFIPNFAGIAEPLTSLLRKNVVFDWPESTNQAFEELKRRLATCATLTNLNAKDPIILKTDASLIGVAAILLQQQAGEWRIVACVSRHLKAAEKNYSIMEIECLAVVYALKKLRHYLLGRHFKILTDHTALRVLNSKTTRNARVERWGLILAEFDYEIIYQKGKLHEDVDMLSRAPVITKSINSISRAVPLDTDQWISKYIEDEETMQLAEEGKKGFLLKGELIYYNNQLYVPPSMRQEVMMEAHNSAYSAHDGIEGTTKRLSDFYWASLKEDVEKMVRSCKACQRRKVERRQPAGLMRQHQAWRPMQIVACDYVGPLPETLGGKRFITVVVDHFSRFVEAKALKDQTASRFSKFFTQFCCRFGFPELLICDNAKTFTNKELDSIRAELGIKIQLSPAGHSRGNAICERAIESLTDKLATIIDNSTSGLDWEMALGPVCFSLNSKISRSTGYTPFELVFARPPPTLHKSTNQITTPHDLYAEVVRQAVRDITANAIANSSTAHERNKTYFDRKRREEEMEVGEEVLVKVKSRSRKLGPKFEGPFKIVSKNNDVYELERSDNARDRRHRHISQMKRFIATLATVGLLAITVASGLHHLVETPPIFWEEDNAHYVSMGEETMTYVIQFVSPCSQVIEFGQMLGAGKPLPPQAPPPPPPVNNIQPPALASPPRPPNRPTPLPVGHRIFPSHQGLAMSPMLIEEEEEWPREVETRGRWMSKQEVEELRPKRDVNLFHHASMLAAECEKVYQEAIVQTLKKFNIVSENRAKRQLAFVAGYIVSNIVDEVRKLWKGELGSQELNQQMTTAVSRLNSRNHIITNALRAINEGQKSLYHDVAELQAAMDRQPALESFQTFILAELVSRRQLLTTLAISFRQGKTDTVLLEELLGRRHLNGILVQDAAITKTKINAEGLSMTINGHVRSNDTVAYVVRSLSYYTNWNDEVTRHDYVGRRLIIQNNRQNCVKAVEETTSKALVDSCATRNYRDADLMLWRPTKVHLEHDPRPSQCHRAGAEFVIYCWGHNISISWAGAELSSTPCPTYSFRLDTNQTFKTSDNLCSHTNRGVTAATVTTKTILTVEDYHFHNYEPAHVVINRQAARIDALLNQAQADLPMIHAAQLLEKPITWLSLAAWGWAALGLVVFVLLAKCIYRRCLPRLGVFDMARFFEGNVDRRSVQREVERQLQDTSENIELEVKRQVCRQLGNLQDFNQVIAASLDARSPRRGHNLRSPRNSLGVSIREID